MFENIFENIAVNKLTASRENYRKQFDKTAFDELVASVKLRGILQPVIVRPNGKKGHYEVVAGNRRLAAAQAAGLKEMPSIIKTLTDEEALEVQVIENSQRENPNPIDEAEGFKRLLKLGKHTAETLAEKIGHSIAYVLSRVKLADLDAKVRDKIANNELSIGHAILLTRLRQPADQKKLMQEIVDMNLSVPDAKERLLGFTLQLASADFDKTKCETCPSRSRNQTVLFPDLKKRDECADKSCFESKTKAHWQAWLKEKAAAGFKTYSERKDVEKLIDSSSKKTFEISADKKRLNSPIRPYPAEYKSLCVACEKHVYFVIPNEFGGGIKPGEICLDKKCLDKMNGNESGKVHDEASSAKMNDYEHKRLDDFSATDCVVRFLKNRLLPIVSASDELLARLTLKFLTDCGFVSGDEIHNAIGEYLYQHDVKIERAEDALTGRPSFTLPEILFAEIPAEHVSSAIRAAIIAYFKEFNNSQTLLAFARSAKFDVLTELTLDREWLESKSFKTKADLLKLTEELELGIKSSSKDAMIDEILKQDLKGKIPAAIANVLNTQPNAEGAGVQGFCAACKYPIAMCQCEFAREAEKV